MVSWFTAFIALIVGVIAFLQWATARQKVVLDLFDKRFAVYEELRKTIEQYFNKGTVNLDDIRVFATATGRAQFLFGREVVSYLETIHKDFIAIAIATAIRPIKTLEDVKESKIVDPFNRLANFRKDLDAVVAPYMKHTQKRFTIPLIDA